MFEHLASFESLYAAYRAAARGKRGHANVAAFEHRLEDNLIRLSRELLSQEYAPGAYRSFYIHEPKRRLISAAPFRDRVVHHALCRLIEPDFERSFVTESYANRKGKGTHRAISHTQHLARRHPYVLQCDLRQFFPSIDHQILRRALNREVTDTRVQWLIDRILAGGRGVLTEEYAMVYFPGDDLFAATRDRGLPIGNLTSQFWANVYMNSFDHFVKRTLRPSGYVRHVDDFLLFGKEKRELWRWKEAVVERLADLRLTLHPHAHPRPVREGIPFLGFVVYPQRRRLKRRKGIHFQRKYRLLADGYQNGTISFAELDASVQGWINHVRYGNTVGLRRAIFRASPLRSARRTRVQTGIEPQHGLSNPA